MSKMQPRWTATEDETIRRAWDFRGVKDAVEWLKHRTPDAVNKRAAFLGLRRYSSPSSPAYKERTPLPAMDLVEQLACVRFRKWAGPVDSTRPLRATIGGGYV